MWRTPFCWLFFGSVLGLRAVRVPGVGPEVSGVVAVVRVDPGPAGARFLFDDQGGGHVVHVLCRQRRGESSTGCWCLETRPCGWPRPVHPLSGPLSTRVGRPT